MEFNVLPRARILSPQIRQRTNQTTNQTVNVILPQQPKQINNDVQSRDASIRAEHSCAGSNRPVPPPATPTPQEPITANDENTSYQPREPQNDYDSCEAFRASQPNPYKNLQPGEVQYNSPNGCVSRDVNLNDPAEKLNKEDTIATINFLKLVLASYMNNPIKYNGYVICSVPVLENLIETLTSCDDCNIEIPDIDAGCCGTSTATHIVPINKIWVRNGETSEIFKYRYSQFLQTFEQYNISLKFVFVE